MTKKMRLNKLPQLLVTLFLFLSLLSLPGLAWAQATADTSSDLRKIHVKADRPNGVLIINTNFSNHRVTINNSEYPAYLQDSGMSLPSNVLHKVKVTKGEVEQIYELSLNPGEALILYVDLGLAVPKAKTSVPVEDPNVGGDTPDASVGYLSITTESEAQVFVDGTLVTAKSPLTRHEVPQGSHSVRVYFLDTRKFSKSREIYVPQGTAMSQHFTKE